MFTLSNTGFYAFCYFLINNIVVVGIMVNLISL